LHDTSAPQQPDDGPTDNTAVVELFPLIYAELRRQAHRHLELEPTGHTLSTTDLVHEAYLRLADQRSANWSGRSHFMAIAATAMRRILVDYARARATHKRGGTFVRLPEEFADLPIDGRADLLLALDEGLDRLRSLDERQAHVVECRFFGGMSEEETAEALGIGLRTAKRDWAKARSWLYREIYADAD
jgi:RNA polymerase sigma factor (TIGR02999 family)